MSLPIQLDDLTGLLTKKAFRDNFSTHLSKAKNGPKEQPLAVGFFDLDGFLSVNETHGHAAGDQLLKVVAGVLVKMLPSSGKASRYGGDEFAVLLPGMEREQAFLLIEQIRAAVSMKEITVQSSNSLVRQTISAGIAAFPVDGRSEADLLRKADQALYRAKLAGRNQVRLAYEEKMVPKTAHFTQTQLERLSALAEAHGASDAELLREAVDDLLTKYEVNDIES